jgi:hypothetical protein
LLSEHVITEDYTVSAQGNIVSEATVPWLSHYLLIVFKRLQPTTLRTVTWRPRCRTTCLTKVRWTLRVPGYHRARRAS